MARTSIFKTSYFGESRLFTRASWWLGTIVSVTGGYFYPSPGIDFEVSGVKLDGAGVNSRRGGVGSLCCYYYYNRGRVHFLMYSIVLLYNSLRPPNALS